MYMLLWTIAGTFQLVATGLGTAVILKAITNGSRTDEMEKILKLGWRSMLLTLVITWTLFGISMLGGYSFLLAKAQENF